MENYLQFPNLLTRFRTRNEAVRIAIAECLGTMIFVLIGDSVVAQSILPGPPYLTYISAPLGWGLALLLATLVIGGVSGAHLNPAVSLAYATVGKLRLKELPIYMLAQYLGAFLGAVLVYFVYKDAIYAVGKPGVWENSGEVTAMVFACYPFNEVSSGRCFVDQVVSTALLLLAVAAISDKKNMAVPRPAQPFAISLCLVGIIYGFLMNSGAPLNPARDLSPRIFTAMAGWGKEVFSYRDYNWFWVPIIGPHLGAVIGIWIYKIAIEIQWPTDTRIEEDLQMENPFERQEST